MLAIALDAVISSVFNMRGWAGAPLHFLYFSKGQRTAVIKVEMCKTFIVSNATNDKQLKQNVV